MSGISDLQVRCPTLANQMSHICKSDGPLLQVRCPISAEQIVHMCSSDSPYLQVRCPTSAGLIPNICRSDASFLLVRCYTSQIAVPFSSLKRLIGHRYSWKKKRQSKQADRGEMDHLQLLLSQISTVIQNRGGIEIIE